MAAVPTYRVLVAGMEGVGRSSFCIQFINNHFVDDYDPDIEDSYVVQRVVDGESVNIDVMDSAGPSAWYRECQRSCAGVFCMYDITSRASFEAAKRIREEGIAAHEDATWSSVLVGNKCDMESARVVGRDEGQQLAHEWACPCFEISAKTRFDLQEAMFALIREIRRAMQRESPPQVRRRRCRIT